MAGVTDIAFILLISLGSALLGEFISWITLYRTSKYKAMKLNIEKATKKVDEMKGKPVSATKNKARRISRFQNNLKGAQEELDSYKRWSLIWSFGVTLSVWKLISEAFDGKVVATLPFHPGFLKNLTRAGIPGADLSQCGMSFIYSLGSLLFRPNIQKFMGTSPPRNLGFAPAQLGDAKTK